MSLLIWDPSPCLLLQCSQGLSYKKIPVHAMQSGIINLSESLQSSPAYLWEEEMLWKNKHHQH